MQHPGVGLEVTLQREHADERRPCPLGARHV
jgi:hypothetical protein